MMKYKTVIVPCIIVLSVAALVISAARSPSEAVPEAALPDDASGFADTVAGVDAYFESVWNETELTAAGPADELLVLRRLSLALHGTLPSLEEIREFESDERPDRLQYWTARMLEDSRFADYFAERLARAFVGVEEGAFIIFRRDRFVGWLSDQLQQNVPYDEIVRRIISETGLWTGKPATNFVTAALANDELNKNKLAGRSVRAFLGQRIDCAQCHDHPFDDWKQHQFEGLAAHFGQVGISVVGVEDQSSFLFDLEPVVRSQLVDGQVTQELRDAFGKSGADLIDRDKLVVAEDGRRWLIKRMEDGREVNGIVEDPAEVAKFVIRSEGDRFRVYDCEREYKVQDRETREDRVITPAVPFHPEWLPQEGTRRERLAGWITHPQNRRFERAIANRVWGLMFGVPHIAPVDDLPDPQDSGDPDLLDILGSDFRKQGYDLRRLVQVIAASYPFRLSSMHPIEERIAAIEAELAPGPDETASSTVPDDEQEEAAGREPAANDGDQSSGQLREQIAELKLKLQQHKVAFAVFPLVRLRPEQVIGSMLQAASVKTIDQNSHLVFRAVKFFRAIGFVNDYGDLGDNELDERSRTIPQALLLMNGNMTGEILSAPFTSMRPIASLASTDERCLETCYLVCVSRRPTDPESRHFLSLLNGTQGGQRIEIVQDILWTLFNSPEFSCNH